VTTFIHVHVYIMVYENMIFVWFYPNVRNVDNKETQFIIYCLLLLDFTEFCSTTLYNAHELYGNIQQQYYIYIFTFVCSKRIIKPGGQVLCAACRYNNNWLGSYLVPCNCFYCYFNGLQYYEWRIYNIMCTLLIVYDD